MWSSRLMRQGQVGRYFNWLDTGNVMEYQERIWFIFYLYMFAVPGSLDYIQLL